jgi:hypothetical protein
VNSCDFNFPIVNFPFICSNIPAAPAYGVYNISQLIRYSRACGAYQDFLDRGLLQTRKILNQGFLLVKLKSSQSFTVATIHNGQKKKIQKDKQRTTKHTHKTKDRVTRTSLKARVGSSGFTSDTRHVDLVTNPVIGHE